MTISVNGETVSIEDKIININMEKYAKTVDLTTAMVYKGSVDSTWSLPTEGQKVGDVYNILNKGYIYNGGEKYAILSGENVVWNGTSWDPLGGTDD